MIPAAMNKVHKTKAAGKTKEQLISALEA